MKFELQKLATLLITRTLSCARQIGLALLAIAIPVALVRFVLIPAFEYLIVDDQVDISLIRRFCMVFAIAGGYWVYVRYSENRTAIELGFRAKPIFLSGFTGILCIALPVSLLFLRGNYHLTAATTDLAFLNITFASIGILIFTAALLEEVIFRAILFGIVERHFGFWIAFFAPSFIFAALHLFNDNWAGWLGVLSVVLLGMMWTLIYAITRNIWAVTANHALWNFTIFTTGLPLTGQQDWRSSAPLQSDYSGTEIWTGGLAGPEYSVLVIGFVALAVLILLMTFRPQQQAGGPTRQT